MDLFTQFEVILACVIFAILVMIFYEFLNTALYNKKGKLIRLIIEVIFFLINTLLFFIIMLKINYAKFNIFIVLFLFVGIIIYILFLQQYFQYVFNVFFKYLLNKKNKLHLFFKAKFDIIKKKVRKVFSKSHEKNSKSKKSHT